MNKLPPWIKWRQVLTALAGMIPLTMALPWAPAGALASIAPQATIQWWLTDPAHSIWFERQAPFGAQGGADDLPTIEINQARTFQPMDGFGFTLTDGSATHIQAMGAGARHRLLRELFGTGEGEIGISVLRIAIGASDLSDHGYTYDDMPIGQTDPELRHFSLDEAHKHVIPVLREVLAMYPEVRILGSPWSAPAWMKTNGSLIGGQLRPEFRDAYARYLVKYLESMRAAGVPVAALTMQNEPLNTSNNPSMGMTAQEQAIFLKDHLGPALAARNLDVKIIIYDHNADRIDFPLDILADPEARLYADGSAFHLYAGDTSALSAVHDAHPDKNIYFTEQWMNARGNPAEDFAWHMEHLVIDGTRNWCRVVLEWNLSSNPSLTPHTPGGCATCLGGITIDGDKVKRNAGYFVMAHVAHLVRPGSVRLDSGALADLGHVAFRRPDGQIVLIVQNRRPTPQRFRVQWGKKGFAAMLEGGAVATCLFWS
jgi:glucosylceramidase